MATAVRWAIRNEMRIRYKWYAEKYKAEGEYDEEEKTDSVDMTQYKVREAIYETILSVALLNETANTQEQDELTEMGKMIRTAIAELPEEARKVVEYRFYNNMDVKTIAIKTGLQPSQVTRIIQSSLNFVKEYLNAREHYGY
jgi:RNA polymerase sigma factor (sigma-70 family)